MSIVLLPAAVHNGKATHLAEPRETRFGNKTIYSPGIDTKTAVLSNTGGALALEAIGYGAWFESAPVDEFAAMATAWLKRNIGRRSEEYLVEDGPLDGRREGFLNETVFALATMARNAKAAGATHILRQRPAGMPGVSRAPRSELPFRR